MTSIVKTLIGVAVLAFSIAVGAAVVNYYEHKEVRTQLEKEQERHSNSKKNHEKEVKSQQELIEQKDKELEDKDKSLEEKDKVIEEKDGKINDLENKNQKLNKDLLAKKERESKKNTSTTTTQVASANSKTQPVSVSRDNSSPRGGKESYFTVTAYTADPAENGGWNVTASGTPLVRGTCAVDPKVIPLGTKLHVEGYGYCTALDTGGAIKGNKIDVLIPNKAEMRRWGRQTVKVKIL